MLSECLSKDGVLSIPARYHSRRASPAFVRTLLQAAAESGATVHVAYLHMCTGLNEDLDALLCLLRRTRVWAVNLGELDLSPEQLDRLLGAVSNSDVTHMFYECERMTPERKVAFRDAIRCNRRKHRRWVLCDPADPACPHCASVRACTHMWFDPMLHSVNAGR